MEILVSRDDYNSERTTGKLFINGTLECFTLEPPIRTGPKVLGHTAIPDGTYSISVYMSPHFGRMVPLLHDVPGFTEVEIHIGNVVEDTRACILVGSSRSHGSLEYSRIAFDSLIPKISGAIARGDEVTIQLITQPQEASNA